MLDKRPRSVIGWQRAAAVGPNFCQHGAARFLTKCCARRLRLNIGWHRWCSASPRAERTRARSCHQATALPRRTFISETSAPFTIAIYARSNDRGSPAAAAHGLRESSLIPHGRRRVQPLLDSSLFGSKARPTPCGGLVSRLRPPSRFADRSRRAEAVGPLRYRD